MILWALLTGIFITLAMLLILTWMKLSEGMVTLIEENSNFLLFEVLIVFAAFIAQAYVLLSELKYIWRR